MVNITTKKTFESKVAPGVSFTLRRLGRIHIAKRDNEIKEHVTEYRIACWKAVDLLKKAGYTIAEDGTYQRNSAEPVAPEVEAEIAKLDEQLTLLLRAYIMPAAIRASLLSIEGVELDGVTVTTAAQLLECGAEADALIQEIYRSSESANKLSDEEKKQYGAAA